jgi:hypothetical protein
MTPWETWCLGVMRGVGEPINAVSVDTHYAWSCAETLPYDLMRYNNPQNSTEPWPGSQDSGAQPGAHDVKIYASVQDGIDATCYTLVNEPYYPAICDNLRAGLPRQQWGLYSTAATELHAWGTGSAWLLRDFGQAPTIGDDFMALIDNPTPDQQAAFGRFLAEWDNHYMTEGRMFWALGLDQPADPSQTKSAALAGILTAVKAIPGGGGTPPDLTALVQAITANTAQLAAQTTELNAISTKISSLTLKAQP